MDSTLIKLLVPKVDGSRYLDQPELTLFLSQSPPKSYRHETGNGLLSRWQLILDRG